MMDKRKQQLDDFFERYAENFNAATRTETPDIEKTALSFADCFLEANPEGINCGKNDSLFREMIPKGYAFYKSIGITSMDIISKEITLLDDYHAMVKIYWQSGFERKDKSKGKIDFSVIYFLRDKENECRIFAYITGDEQKALKDNRLI
jgi:hypothetical protein